MTHKKEGFLVIETRPGDEVFFESGPGYEHFVGALRIVVKDFTKNGITIGFQAPKEIKIETVQPWRNQKDGW